jgi:hypothetical protein
LADDGGLIRPTGKTKSDAPNSGRTSVIEKGPPDQFAHDRFPGTAIALSDRTRLLKAEVCGAAGIGTFPGDNRFIFSRSMLGKFIPFPNDQNCESTDRLADERQWNREISGSLWCHVPSAVEKNRYVYICTFSNLSWRTALIFPDSKLQKRIRRELI